MSGKASGGQGIDLLIENITELGRRAEQAEFHARGVRQLQKTKVRWHKLIEIIALRLDRFDTESLLALHNVMMTTKSGDLQDLFCLALNGGKRNGYFVEFGACDGDLISNTRALEESLGWTGILSEPSTQWHKALEANRNCIIEKRCVWHTTGETVEFAEFSNDKFNTKSSVLDDTKSAPIASKYGVETVSLQDMLH